MCSLEEVRTLRLLKEDIAMIKCSSILAHTKIEGGALKARSAKWEPDERRERYVCRVDMFADMGVLPGRNISH